MDHSNKHMDALSTDKATNARGYSRICNQQAESLVINLETECSNHFCSYKHHSTHPKKNPYIRNTVYAKNQIHQTNIVYHVHQNHMLQLHNCGTNRLQTDSHTSDTNSIAEHTAETRFHWIILSPLKRTSQVA
jgi:hypothetical protein